METTNEFQNEKSNKKYYAFTGCMFIGMGMGMFFDNVAVGMFIGMGVGYVVMGIIKANK